MWTMIFKMSVATLLYVVITAGLWWACRRYDCRHGGEGAAVSEGSGQGRVAFMIPTWLKLLIGLAFGACSVAANHFGIEYENMILNVRDIGPLAAGLFFSPLSGVIAGVIGGAERILAGELWYIGHFTELACGMSTCLAGLLAAFLNRKVYEGKRPPVPQAFFLGAVMEVFHMYAVLFTNRREMGMAYEVVKIAATPMIIFTAIGLALCSAVILKLSGEETEGGLRKPEEKISLAIHFQRRLLIVTVVMFLLNFAVSYAFQTRMADSTTALELQYLVYENSRIFGDNKDLEGVKKHLKEQEGLTTALVLIDAESGELLNEDAGEGASIGQKDLEVLKEHLDKNVFSIKMVSLNNEVMRCFCVPLGSDVILAAFRPISYIYESRDAQILESTLSDILLFTVLYVLVAMLVDALVVNNLKRVNVSLDRITNGNLDEKVWVRTSTEFTELSEDINQTVTALKGYIDQAEQRMQQELKLAKAIQAAALPSNFNLPAENIELYALMTPAKQVGGDFYDFFYADRDKLCLVIADVSGKGVPAAMFMMRAKTAIKNYASHGNSAAHVLEHVNNTLCEGNDAEMFVTVWLGILDLKTGKMNCANAGHEYPVLMRAGGDYELLKDRHGLVLAAMEGIRLKEYEIDLDPGDRLFVYTDGVPEAINEKEEAYGTDRLTDKLNKLKDMPQEQTLESVLRDIRNFAGTAEQFDDITMMGITFGKEVSD